MLRGGLCGVCIVCGPKVEAVSATKPKKYPTQSQCVLGTTEIQYITDNDSC
jgi:hypothetical protein